MSTLENILEYAEKRLDEEIKNGEASDITYWHGYRDAIKAMMSEQLPNEPLTLDELWEMDGGPVWLKMLESCAGCFSKWVILSKDDIRWICDGLGKGIYGKRFVYYRRKPEEA